MPRELYPVFLKLAELPVVVVGGGPVAEAKLDGLLAAGARHLGSEPCASWKVELSAADVLDAWRRKPALGGATLPSETKAAVLAELESFARSRFDSLEAREPAEERYVIEGALLG